MMAYIEWWAMAVRCPLSGDAYISEHPSRCSICSGQGWVSMGLVLDFDGTSIKVRDAFL